MKKEYTKGDLTIVWKPEICEHTAECVKNASKVFNPAKKPWIQLDQDDAETVMAAVRKCPSGALTIKGE